jgi:hypothetical protein
LTSSTWGLAVRVEHEVDAREAAQPSSRYAQRELGALGRRRRTSAGQTKSVRPIS